MFTESGPLIALAVAVALLVGIVGTGFRAVLQFRRAASGRNRSRRSNSNRGGGGWFGGDLFAPFQQQAPKRG